jgi:alpha-L-arabinofuranosidase
MFLKAFRSNPIQLTTMRIGRKLKIWTVFLVFSGFSLLLTFGNESAVIAIDASQSGPAINPRMYGIFLEEINHGVDGGLYGELVRNRGFEDSRPPEGYTLQDGVWRNSRGFDSGFSRYGYTTNGVPFWSLIQTGSAKGRMNVETTGGITEQSCYCLRLDVEPAVDGQVGVANEGFFGIGVRAGEQYRLSLHARGAEFKGPLVIRLEGRDGAVCSDEVKIEGIGSSWQKFEGFLSGLRTDPKARLVIEAGAKGTFWLDFVSLFPAKTWKNRPNGLRTDIAEMIAGLHPGFVRFPGGCVVEAGSTETAYNWKLTVGAVEERQERWGPWNYRRTQGMGLFEYLRFCEDLGAEPLFVGFAGQTCIFRAPQLVPMENMGWVRDNLLDVVNYANGPTDSKWGALRAAAGHPAPFNLKLLEIGNENQGHQFEQRYNLIHDTLKSRYPDLQCFADLSWTGAESMRDAQWDIQDQHYYESPRWFAARFNEYDERDRKLPPLYLGELAVTTPDAGNLRGNLRAALSEGVYLMGCERNADVVRMVSYAPLLANVDGRTELTGSPPPWHGMIYFDGTRVFGTASYYLWKLFGASRPDHCVQTDVSFLGAKPVIVSGQIGLGTWADTAEFKDVLIEKDGKVLYHSDFSTNADGWQTGGGRWSVENGVYRQGRTGQGFSYFGDESWSDYALSLKAQNTGGAEGFLIIFGRKNGERYWWNVGGWGNTQHAIEFNQTPVGSPVPAHIERNHWYDVKIELSGPRIRCYLDGKLIHDATVPRPQKFFAVAGTDANSGDLILKAINLGSDAVSAELKLAGPRLKFWNAHTTVLTSHNPSDNNSLEEPMKVRPVESSLNIESNDFTHEFPPYSFTVFRLKAP